MSCLMHGECETVIDRSGESVTAKEPGVPCRSLKKVKGEDLEEHGACYSEFGLMIRSKELFDLGVSLDDGLPPAVVIVYGVRFKCVYRWRSTNATQCWGPQVN